MQTQTNTAHKLKIVLSGRWGRKEEEVVYVQWDGTEKGKVKA